MKTHTIQKDIENNRFDLKIESSKRKGIQPCLKHVEFDMSVYSKSQAGYLTDRPVRRALALES